MTEGQAHDGRQFESLYESLEQDNVLASVALDKGYDADRIRARLALDGIAAVIPPLKTRKQPLPCDQTLYRERNRIVSEYRRAPKPPWTPREKNRTKVRFVPRNLVSSLCAFS